MAPRPSRYASFPSVLWTRWNRNQFHRKPPTKARRLHTHFSPFFPPMGKAMILVFSPHLDELYWLCLQYCKFSGAASMLSSSLLFSEATRNSKYVGFPINALCQARKKTVQAFPSKAEMLNVHSTPLFHLPKRSYILDFSFWSWSVLALGKVSCSWHEMTFLTCFSGDVFGFQFAWDMATS